MKLLSLDRHPRRAFHSLRLRHTGLNRLPKRNSKPQNILQVYRKPALRFLHRVAQRGICSNATQVQGADHGAMTIARRAIKSSLAECIHQLQLHLQQIDESTHITQEQVLGGIAQRFPKYQSVISAIPAMAECIPGDLKKDIVGKAQSKSFKIAFVLLKMWWNNVMSSLILVI